MSVWRKKNNDEVLAAVSEPPAELAVLEPSPPAETLIIARENQLPDNESLLRRMVARLCIAARGQEPRLDVDLIAIQQALRSGADGFAMESLLARLTASVAEMDAKPEQAAPVEPPLIPVPGAGFSTQVTDLSSLPRTAVDEEAPLPAATLLGYLAERLELPLDFTFESTEPEDAKRPGSHLSDELGFAGTDAFGVGAGSRGGKLWHESESDPLRLADRLAMAINAQLLRLDDERQQLEKVLQQVTSQLNAIGSLIKGEAVDRSAARQSRQDFDARVRSEIRDLDQQIHEMDDPLQMRQATRSHIEAIDDQLQVFETREQTRDASAEVRAERMNDRIHQLEREAVALQSALLREQKLALTDALTRIPNRLAFQERMKQDFQRWKRFQRPLTLLIWDIDHFKQINDTYGHPAGDKVLQRVAHLFKGQIRSTDFVARQGGEEFVMLLDGADENSAFQLADRMREAVAGMGFHCRGAPVPVTISCGLTMFRESDQPDAVYQRADQLLYKAKHNGRNRCERG